MPLSTNDATNQTANSLVETLKGTFGTPAGYRPAHAKGILLNGTFTPSQEAKSLSKAPHFNNASTPVTVRFSNSTGIPQIPDNSNDANPRGMAIRFHLPPSQDGRRVHTDIVSHSTPFFPVRTGELFLEMFRAIGASSAPDAPSPPPIAAFLQSHPSAAAFVSAPKPTPASFATEAFFGVNAFKLTNATGSSVFVRYRVIPDAGKKHLSDDDAKSTSPTFLQDEIQSRVAGGTASFTLTAQVAHPNDVTDDATVQWPENREVVTLGTIVLDKVVANNDEAQRTIIFDPIPRDVDGVEASADPLLDVRASVYLISGRERRAAK